MNIRDYRKQVNMSQQELARRVNVDQSAVSLWESGKSKPLKKIWPALARALEIDVETVEKLVKETDCHASVRTGSQ